MDFLRSRHEWIDDPEGKIERHDLSRVLEFGNMFRANLATKGRMNTFDTSRMISRRGFDIYSRMWKS
jgi:hypothetical protein